MPCIFEMLATRGKILGTICTLTGRGCLIEKPEERAACGVALAVNPEAIRLNREKNRRWKLKQRRYPPLRASPEAPGSPTQRTTPMGIPD